MSNSVTPNLEPAGADSVQGAGETGRNNPRNAEGYAGHFIKKRSEASAVSGSIAWVHGRSAARRNVRDDDNSSICVMLAERVGFKPTNEGTPSPAFEAGAFNRSATSPFGPDACKELQQDSLGISAQQTRNHLRSVSEDGPRKHIAIAAHCSIVEIIR